MTLKQEPPTETIFSLKIAEGKYEIFQTNKGSMALRYDEPWRDITGDNLILLMAYELAETKAKLKQALEDIG